MENFHLSSLNHKLSPLTAACSFLTSRETAINQRPKGVINQQSLIAINRAKAL